MGSVSSGKVDIVMVACVAREVTMIVEPALFYRASRIHILNFVSEKDDTEAVRKRAQLYRDVRDTVCSKLEAKGLEVIIHGDEPTYRFDSMMRAVYSILKEEESMDSLVYVNISGGTYEYAAAASIASMMVPGVRLFNVGTKNSIESAEDLRKMLTKDGELVGTTDDVLDPFSITAFKIEPPDIRRLKALKLFDSLDIMDRTNTTMIGLLIENGIWSWPVKDSRKERIRGTSVELLDKFGSSRASKMEEYRRRLNSEKVRYQKDFIDVWKKRGWIRPVESGRRRKYELTVEGRSQLDMFCLDDEVDF